MSENFFSNRELFEKMETLKEEIMDLKGEMRETRILIKQYNGLRSKIDERDEQITNMSNELSGIKSTIKIVKWGISIILALLFPALTFLVDVFKRLH